MTIQYGARLFWLDPKDSMQVRVLKNEYNLCVSRLNLYQARGWKEGQLDLLEQLAELRKRIDQHKG